MKSSCRSLIVVAWCCVVLLVISSLSRIKTLGILINQSSFENKLSEQAPSNFPRKLHYFSLGDDPANDELAQNNQTHALLQRTEIISNNPEWQVHLWTTEECGSLVREHFPDFYPHWTLLKPPLKKWNTVGPMILYVHGGIYIYNENNCVEEVDFSDLIGPETTLLFREPWLGVENSLDNHLMGSVANHSFWSLYLANVMKDIINSKNSSVTRHTGPRQLYLTFREYEKGLRMDRSQLQLLRSNGDESKYALVCKEANGGNRSTICSKPRHCHAMHYTSRAVTVGYGENENQNGRFTTVDSTLTRQRWNDFLNNTKPVIFIHIPKNGGTTIEEHMGYHTSIHSTAAEMRDINTIEYDKALSFAVLRHPLDRAMSMYRYAKNGGNQGHHDRIKFAWVKNLTFSDFVEAVAFRRELNFAPQSYFVLDPQQHQQQQQQPGHVLVDMLLCIENLKAGWEELTTLEPSLEKYGSFPDTRKRTTTTTHPRNANVNNKVDAATQQRVKEIYHLDFLLWQVHCGINKRSSIMANNDKFD